MSSKSILILIRGLFSFFSWTFKTPSIPGVWTQSIKSLYLVDRASFINSLFLFQLDTHLFSFFTFTVFLYMFRTGWSIIRRIKLHVQPLVPFPQSLRYRAWSTATHDTSTTEGTVPEAARVIWFSWWWTSRSETCREKL